MPRKTSKPKRKPIDWPPILEEVHKFVPSGEKSIREIARKYGVSEGSIRNKFAHNLSKAKDLALQKKQVDDEFNSLPPIAHNYALRILSDLQAASESFASATKSSGVITQKLYEFAEKETEKLDPGKSADENKVTLGSINTLTKIANSASYVGLNLLSSNKDRLNAPPDDTQNLKDMSDDELLKIATGGGS